MFCSNCGNVLNDNAKFCNKCGAPTKAAPQQPVCTQPAVSPTVHQPPYTQQGYASPASPRYPQYTPPVAQPTPPPQPNPNIPRHSISKKEYINRYSRPTIKTTDKAKFITSMVCLAIILFNFFFSYFGCSILSKVPLTKTIFYFVAKNEAEKSDVDIDMEDYVLAARRSERELRRNASDLKDDLSNTKGVSRKQSKAIINAAKNLSVHNVLTLVNTIDDDELELIELYDDFDGIKDYIALFRAAAYISIVLFILGLAFTLTGALTQKRGFITTGFVFSLIYSILFGGWLQSILLVIGFVTVYVLTFLVDKHYKNFQLGIE